MKYLLPNFSNTWYVYFPAQAVLVAFFPLFQYLHGYLVGGLLKSVSEKAYGPLLATLPMYLSGVLICVILYPVAEYLKSISFEKSTMNLKDRLLRHIVRLPTRVVQGMHSGNLQSIFTVDADKAMESCNTVSDIVLTMLFANTLSVVYVFKQSMTLGYITIGVGIMSLLFNGVFAPYLRKLNVQERDSRADVSEKTSDLLSGHTLINQDNRRDFFVKRLVKAVDRFFLSGWKIKKTYIYAAAPSDLSKYLIDAIILATAIWLLSKGELTITQATTCWTVGTGFGFLMRMIAWKYVYLQGDLASGDRIANILSQPVEANGMHQQVDRSQPAVCFQNVKFHYDEDTQVLDNFNYTFHTGTSTMLVGRSGQGKSTVMKLLMRYYDVVDGRILVFGRDVREYDLQVLRSLISYIPQQPVLLNSTIYENILIGKPDADKTAVQRAACLANAVEFIDALPSGYDTIVGERGTKLSGGQKQRIIIARAILKNAPILIMDEATSALDNRFEHEVRQALLQVSENLTVITVTHRLNTIPDNTQIIVIDDGMIVEEGTHDELVDNDQNYAQLLTSQSM